MFARHLSFRLALTLATGFLAVLPASAESHVRIVRLSDVQGDVQVDRNTGQGFEKAFLNLPLTQGVKLRTGNDARAELELEDGSTVRVADNSVVDLPELSMQDSGIKLTTVHLQEGMAYVNFLGAKDAQLKLTFAREQIALSHAAHLRINLGDAEADVAAYKGEVEVTGKSGTVSVDKNHTASFDLADSDKYKVAKNVEPDPYDSWDKEQSKYHDQYASNSYSSYSPYSYGTADLQYYGNFFNAPGYGTLWQPYFTGAGWDPFMNGAWAFWPGSGYGWVSGYPWGWTPYHYGSWVYLPANGWAWQPGGAWMGWNTIPTFANRPPQYMAPRPPASPGQRIVAVNQGPVPVRKGLIFSHLEVPKNSAGLGVERGSVKNLGDFSRTAVQHGSVALRAPSAPTTGWLGGFDSPRAVSRSSGSYGRAGSYGGGAARSVGPGSVGHGSHVGGVSGGRATAGHR